MGGTYRTDPSVESRVTAVETGDGRHFLVIQFRIREWKTLVLQHAMVPDSWLSRRELHENMEPIPALTGVLLGPQQLPHPIEDLKSRLAIERRANWNLRNEIRTLKERQARPARKRGRRVSGNP